MLCGDYRHRRVDVPNVSTAQSTAASTVTAAAPAATARTSAVPTPVRPTAAPIVTAQHGLDERRVVEAYIVQHGLDQRCVTRLMALAPALLLQVIGMPLPRAMRNASAVVCANIDKVTPCRDCLAGRCQRGATCSLAHRVPHELSMAPDVPHELSERPSPVFGPQSDAEEEQ